MDGISDFTKAAATMALMVAKIASTKSRVSIPSTVLSSFRETKIAGSIDPTAMPTGFTMDATTVATSRSEVGNQAAATLGGTLVKKGCASAARYCPVSARL
jgi:hypothetical protein